MGNQERIAVPVHEAGTASQQVAVRVGGAAVQPEVAHAGLGAEGERLLMPGDVTGLLEPGSTGGRPQIQKDLDGFGDDEAFRRFAAGTPQELSVEAQAAGGHGMGRHSRRGSIVQQGLSQDRRDMVTHSDQHPRTGF